MCATVGRKELCNIVQVCARGVEVVWSSLQGCARGVKVLRNCVQGCMKRVKGGCNCVKVCAMYGLSNTKPGMLEEGGTSH